jgi:hypothetical protein
MYLFFVETKGLTLEEMDEIFDAVSPRKASLSAQRQQRAATLFTAKEDDTAL